MRKIEVILLDPVHHIIHSIRLHRCYKFCLSITFLLLDFDWHCPASGSLLLLSQIAPDQSALNQIALPAPAPAMPPTSSIRLLILTIITLDRAFTLVVKSCTTFDCKSDIPVSPMSLRVLPVVFLAFRCVGWRSYTCVLCVCLCYCNLTAS